MHLVPLWDFLNIYYVAKKGSYVLTGVVCKRDFFLYFNWLRVSGVVLYFQFIALSPPPPLPTKKHLPRILLKKKSPMTLTPYILVPIYIFICQDFFGQYLWQIFLAMKPVVALEFNFVRGIKKLSWWPFFCNIFFW